MDFSRSFDAVSPKKRPIVVWISIKLRNLSFNLQYLVCRYIILVRGASALDREGYSIFVDSSSLCERRPNMGSWQRAPTSPVLSCACNRDCVVRWHWGYCNCAKRLETCTKALPVIQICSAASSLCHCLYCFGVRTGFEDDRRMSWFSYALLVLAIILLGRTYSRSAILSAGTLIIGFCLSLKLSKTGLVFVIIAAALLFAGTVNPAFIDTIYNDYVPKEILNTMSTCSKEILKAKAKSYSHVRCMATIVRERRARWLVWRWVWRYCRRRGLQRRTDGCRIWSGKR